MKKATLTFVVLTTAIQFTVAQTQKLKTVADAHQQAEQVIGLIANSEVTEAFEILKKYWPQPSYQIDELSKTTAQQIPLLEDTFGPLRGYEFASSKSIGSFGHVENYVLKYEKNALRMYLIYYNNGSGWQVNSLLWDDRWDYLFDDSAKSK